MPRGRRASRDGPSRLRNESRRPSLAGMGRSPVCLARDGAQPTSVGCVQLPVPSPGVDGVCVCGSHGHRKLWLPKALVRTGSAPARTEPLLQSRAIGTQAATCVSLLFFFKTWLCIEGSIRFFFFFSVSTAEMGPLRSAFCYLVWLQWGVYPCPGGCLLARGQQGALVVDGR
ncbi:unnamed protein product [Pipistrellus nathusii]|uniref:Uncharacterized protein n=1 Tax=Pipistrellus nathusii TaxID=59473 RepID=A0ABP0AAS5_PIPNA